MKFTNVDKSDLYDHWRAARNKMDIDSMRHAAYLMQKTGMPVLPAMYREMNKYW